MMIAFLLHLELFSTVFICEKKTVKAVLLDEAAQLGNILLSLACQIEPSLEYKSLLMCLSSIYP